MAKKIIELSQLTEQTLRRVTSGRKEWSAYLSFIGRLYKYSNMDQLLIYAQRPDAIACAKITVWNKLQRMVNRGSKGIALIDSSSAKLKLTYVFDITDTHPIYNSHAPYVWTMEQRYKEKVMTKISEQFGLEIKQSDGFEDFLDTICTSSVKDELDEYLTDFLSCRNDSLMEELDEHSAGVFFRETIIDSVWACVAARCGLHDSSSDETQFRHLLEFSNPATATCLCEAVSNISESVLRDLEHVVKQIHKDEIRRNSNEREGEKSRESDLHPMRRLSTAEYQPAGERLSADILRGETQNIPDGTSERDIRQHGSQQYPGGSPDGDRSTGQGDGRPSDSGHGGVAGGDGGPEGIRSDGMGSPDEQHTEFSEGNSPERSDLQLNITGQAGGENEPPALFFTEVSENVIDAQIHGLPELISVSDQLALFDMGDAQPIYENDDIDTANPLFTPQPIPQEVINEALCTAGNQHNSTLRVVVNYMAVRPETENIAFLRREFGTDNGRGIEHDGRKYAVWFTEEGILFAQGTSIHTGQSKTTLTWENCSQRILDLLNDGRYVSQPELDSAYQAVLKSGAESLIFIARDLSEEGEKQNLFPIVRSVYEQEMGFPECTENLCSYISNGNGLSKINAEYRAFMQAYRNNRRISRFRVSDFNTHRAELILGGVDLPRREFTAQPDFLLHCKMFITQDEIEHNFLSESASSRLAIYSYFCLHNIPKEKQQYFKSIYGTYSGSGTDAYDITRSSKGLTYKRSYNYTLYDTVNLSFSKIVKIYDKLIAQNRFPGEDALAEIPKYQVHEVARSVYWAFNGAPEDIQRPYSEVADFYKGVPEIESQLTDYDKVHEILTNINHIMDVTPQNDRYYQTRTDAQKALFEYAAGSYDLFGGRHKDLTAPRITKVPKLTSDNSHTDSQNVLDDVDPAGIRERLNSPEAQEETDRLMAYAEKAVKESAEEPYERFTVMKTEDGYAIWDDIHDGYYIDENGVTESFTSKEAADDYLNDVRKSVAEKERAEWLYIERFSQGIEEPQNFRIKADQLDVGGPKAKYAANIAAIQTLKAIESHNRNATAEEQEILSRYVGWGGISQAFDPSIEGWSKEYEQLKALLTEAEYTAARESTLTAFYTPPVIIKAMYQSLSDMGFQTGNIIDPGCGDGNFIGLLPESMSSSHFYGIEIDSISGRIAQQLYPKSSITIDGFENTKLPDSFFDLAIGNVPFGQYKVADQKYDKNNFLIHDYYFAKTLDKVRPGGIIAFITSSGTMDKQNAGVRRYIAQRAELIGAVRLPNNAFKAAGTEVVADILFLQKRDRMIDAEPDWTQLDRTPDGYLINSYFVEHPEMVLGVLKEESTQFGMNLTCAPIEGAELGEQLGIAFSNLSASITEYEMEPDEVEEHHAKVIPADPDTRNFSYCLFDDEIYYRENSMMTCRDFNGIPEKRVRGMMKIRDCLREMIDEQLAGCSDEVLSSLQQKLNDLYDSYIKDYDRLNSRGNKLVFELDSSYPLLCSLEIFDENGNFKTKADIFTKRTIRQETKITHVDTAAEALAVSIGEKAKVDLPFMAELMGGVVTEQDVADDLKGVIFLNPETERWETADEYLSGNVRLKLTAARHYNELGDGMYAVNVEALTAAQPRDLEASEIDVRLGATWIEPDIIRQFMFELFEVAPYLQKNIDIKYSPYTDSWNVQGKHQDNSGTSANITYGTNRKNGYELLQDALNLRSSQVYDEKETLDGKVRVINTKETMLAQQKQDSIKAAFKDWIFRDPGRRELLVRKYNDKFNAIVPRHYDGSHIRFVGMNPEISLRKHQIDAVARGLYGGNTLLAHCVGAGKTFTMAAIAMESKRLGLCQKSLFVVPNHLIQDWCGEFLRLYPSANLLMSTEKDFETANRKKFCARIATGDYDAVIIGHSQFERIPISAERQEAQLNSQIDEISFGIEQVKEENGEHSTVKQMEILRKQLENKLEKLCANDKKDNVVTFEELGVDKLFVDEAHGYKNLFLYTKMRNVAGISQTEAQKSTDLFNKCRFLDELTEGKGVVFATGTPVSNSMTELYTNMRYLQYAALERMGLLSFDAWASTFGEVVTSMELAPEGSTYRPKSRFARFCNLPEMMNLWREVADIQTADMLQLPVPEAIYHTEVVEPTATQRDMVKELGKRADVVRRGGVDPTEDNMLRITNDGRSLALDQRLIDPRLPDDEDTKINRCVDNLYRIWRETSADRCTQLVFCDLSTPKGIVHMDMVDGVSVITGFQNVYDDIRCKLLYRGVPEEEIAFIHDAKTQAKKAALFSKVRSGHVRILIGSTAKMGAGTNIQNRLIALHHLDVPWRPSDIEQREGRIIRQGNMNSKVGIYRYVTKDTFDAYSWQTIENKQKFIGQIMTGKSPARSCEDVDSTALSYAEVKALASGNPFIKEKMDLDIAVAKLNALKANYRNEQFRLEDKVLKYLPNEIQQTEKNISDYRADIALADRNVLADFMIELEGKTYTDKALAMENVLTLSKLVPDKETKMIGCYRGFSLELYATGMFGDVQMRVKGSAGYSFSLGKDAFGNTARLNNLIAKIPELLERSEAELKSMKVQLETSKAALGKPFLQDQELQEKTSRLNELNVMLRNDQPQQETEDELEME